MQCSIFSANIVFLSPCLHVFACVYTQVISLLPEEWRPGETLLGCPWQAVIVTALVGVFTIVVFIWNTILAVSIVTLALLTHTFLNSHKSLKWCVSFAWNILGNVRDYTFKLFQLEYLFILNWLLSFLFFTIILRFYQLVIFECIPF